MVLSPTQLALAVTMVVVAGYALTILDRGAWRSRLEARFLYGIPWGTLVTVAVVVGFYLFAQGGLRHWSEPVIYAYISWSYFYPTGILTAGIAHGNPGHLISNMTATVVFAPIAEYVWSHYPPRRRAARASQKDRADGGQGGGDGPLTNPWARAFVIFPGALLGAALVTSTFSLGPGLGFSGAVFAIFGFALVTYPLASIVGVVATSAVSLLVTAMATPIVREGIESGAPSPPAWAGIGFQAHLLGFLLGVMVGIALLSHRGRRPSAGAVFAAMILLGLAQSLWLLAWPVGDDTFALYRGAGVILVFLLAVVVTVAVAGSTRELPEPLSESRFAPNRRQLAGLWLSALLALFVVLVVAAAVLGEPVALVAIVMGVFVAVLGTPALAAFVPSSLRGTGPMTVRQSAVVCLVVFTILVAAPSLPLSLGVVADDAVPQTGVERGDYTVTYVSNETSGQTPGVDVGDDEFFASELDGVVVASADRNFWTTDTRPDVLAHDGNTTVAVGSVGWRDAVHAERTGWEVVGNDTVYAVDLSDADAEDEDSERVYTADSATANAAVDGHTLTLVATEDGFELEAAVDGEVVGSATIPETGDSTTLGDLEVRTEAVDGVDRVIVEHEETTVQVAEAETY